MQKYYKLLVLLAVFLVNIDNSHAVITWSGSSEWNIKVFASPGISGSGIQTISAVVVSDWKATGTNKVYAAAYKLISGTQGSTDKYIYEFFWNGTSWEHETTTLDLQGGFIGAYDIIKDMGFFNIRGDNSRLYFITLRGSIYEYSIDTNNYWKMDIEIKNGSEGHSIENFKVADGRGNGKLNIYAGDANWFYEYDYSDTNGWILKNKMPTSRGGAGWITDIAFGDWKTRGRKAYLSYFGVDAISEVELQGDTWNEVSEIGINNHAAGLGSPTLLVADCGKGERLYAIQGNSIVECTCTRGKWTIKSLVDDNYPGGVVSIAYGRISNSPNDPVCLYALVERADTNDKYNKDTANEIHEYTFIPGVRIWKRTCIVPLYEQGTFLENDPSFYKSGGQVVHLYMANARNEKETDTSGNQLDKYKRLYIVDDFGTCWECSVPPRKERPPDPDDPFNPNNPNYMDPNDPNNPNNQGKNSKIIPSILGK